MEKIITIHYIFDKEELKSLKSQMRKLGYSYRSLSKKICLCPSYISDLFNGYRYFDDRKLNLFKNLGFVFSEEV